MTGAYEIDSELGRGGMGIVFRAKDLRLKRTVAIKILPPELAFRLEIRSRFLKEAETAAGLSHPNIVPIYSVDEREGLVFFVMQYVDGENVAKRLHDRGPSSADETRRIVREVADALAYAHSRGVIHRDIKPDNILLTKDEGRALVTDFGIARAISDGNDARLTATGVAIGTPAYMSPEQCSGERDTDGRSDLYSLGIVGYQMLAGRLPFEGTTTPAMLVKHISERPVPVEELVGNVPPDLARAIMLCLEKEPANRFPSAAALVTALDTREMPAGTGQASSARRPSTERAGMLPPPPPLSYGATAPRYATASSGNAGIDGYGSYPDAGRMPMSRPAPYDPGVASAEDLQRWYAPEVEQFRRKLAPFIAVSAVAAVGKVFGFFDIFGVPAVWSVYIAFKYAKLWSDGYDWRDVLREPRERLFSDVVATWVDTVKAFFDPVKRAELRDRKRYERQLVRPSGASPLTPLSPVAGVQATSAAMLRAGNTNALASLTGDRATVARQALADRDEILRLIDSLPRPQRDVIGDVPTSARSLADRIQSLAVLLEDLERNHAPSAFDALEKEISLLEAAANPLDVSASEDRVRRLAYLKRQRRSVADVAQRREKTAARLESCRVALQNMRFDVLRLRTGSQSPQSITLVAEEAMALARDVDGMLAAQEQVARGESARRSG
jgi:serine/threonine-protein kinase